MFVELCELFGLVLTVVAPINPPAPPILTNCVDFHTACTSTHLYCHPITLSAFASIVYFDLLLHNWTWSWSCTSEKIKYLLLSGLSRDFCWCHTIDTFFSTSFFTIFFTMIDTYRPAVHILVIFGRSPNCWQMDVILLTDDGCKKLRR